MPARTAHAIRKAEPLIDFKSDRPNRCARSRCTAPVRYVQTWRNGRSTNATFGGRLLCAAHAAQTTIKLNIARTSSSPGDLTV
jgi:hypothetical protein